MLVRDSPTSSPNGPFGRRVGTTAREWKTFCGNNWPSLKSSGSFATFAARYRASSHVNYQSPIVLTDELGRRQGSRAMRRGHLAAAVTKLPDRWRKSCRANGTQGATSKILPLYDYGAQRRRGVADRLIQHLNGRKASVTIPNDRERKRIMLRMANAGLTLAEQQLRHTELVCKTPLKTT